MAENSEVFHNFDSKYVFLDTEEPAADFLFCNGPFVGMPFIKKDNSDFFVENHALLHQMFTDIHEQLEQAISSFDSINALLGFNATVNTNNQQNIAAVLTAIRGNSIIPFQWFDCDMAKLKTMVSEAKSKATYLLETKNRILADWESDVLCLDYAPILLRYKTEYTSFFKVFKSQYKQDKKKLQALSKTVIKKLPDEVASSLLLIRVSLLRTAAYTLFYARPCKGIAFPIRQLVPP